MKRISGYFIFCALLISQAFARNVGIGASSLQNRLHVLGSSSLVFQVESSSDAGAEIIFKTFSGTKGVLGAYNGTMELFATGPQSGTGNFTVFKDIGVGMTETTVSNELISDNDHIIVVTPVKLFNSTGTCFAMTEVVNFGQFRVWTYTDEGVLSNFPFRFVVYRLN